MVEVSLLDMQYRNVQRAHSTLVIKRKSVGIYKGRLRIRGDTVPTTQKAPISIPTANRCGVRLICLISSQTRWAVHALDVSQAFSQAGHVNRAGSAILIHPPMVKLPRGESLHPPGTDLEKIQSPRRGFFLLRPLYGSRDAPVRRFLKLSHVLASSGIRQLQSDVCFFTWHNRGRFEGLLLAHVEDLLFTGCPISQQKVSAVLKTLRTGELETPTEKTQSPPLGF